MHVCAPVFCVVREQNILEVFLYLLFVFTGALHIVATTHFLKQSKYETNLLKAAYTKVKERGTRVLCKKHIIDHV